MTVGEAILAGDARAYGRLSDIIRARGGTYRETVQHIKKVFAYAGRTPPSDGDIEDKFAECDALEARS